MYKNSLVQKRVIKAPVMRSNGNGISDRRRLKLIPLLNRRLASALDLQMQMKQAFWNVRGAGFTGLPELFGQFARSAEACADLIAGRIVQLGGVAEGTVRVAAARSALKECPLETADGTACVEAVSRALSTFGREAQDAIGEAARLNDAGTVELFTEISHGLEQWLEFVESHSRVRN